MVRCIFGKFLEVLTVFLWAKKTPFLGVIRQLVMDWLARTTYARIEQNECIF